MNEKEVTSSEEQISVEQEINKEEFNSSLSSAPSISPTKVVSTSLMIFGWIQTIFLFFFSTTFLYILIGALLILLFGALIFIIIILFSIDFNNVPYYYTREPVTYNLPSISYSLNDYGTGADSLSKFVQGKEFLKLDLISNIYFYKENQDFLSTIKYPISTMNIGDLKTIDGNLFSKNKGVDFKYSFQSFTDINGILDKTNLNDYKESFSSLPSKSKINYGTGKLFLPIITVNFQTQQSTVFGEDNKKHFKLDIPVYGYGIKYVLQDDSSKAGYGMYQLKFFLDIEGTGFPNDKYKGEEVKNLIRNYYFINFIKPNLLPELSTALKTPVTDVNIVSFNKDVFTYFNTQENKDSFNKCINSIKFLNNYSDLFLEKNQCSYMDISIYEYILKGTPNDEKYKDVHYTNSLINQFVNANKSWLGFGSALNDLNNIKYLNSNTDFKDLGNSEGDIVNKNLNKITNPYLSFPTDEVDKSKNDGNELELSPGMFLYSFYLMQMDYGDKIIGYDYLKSIKNTDWNALKDTYLGMITNNIDKKNQLLIEDNSVWYSNSNYGDYYKQYVDKYFYQNSSLNKDEIGYNTLDKYWDNFIKVNYKTNFVSYGIKDYYYVGTDNKISDVKKSFNDKYLNVYPDESNEDDKKVETISDGIFSCNSKSSWIPGKSMYDFYTCLIKDSTQSKPIYYIDKKSVYSFDMFQGRIKANNGVLWSKDMDSSFFNKFKKDNVVTGLDSLFLSGATQEKNYISKMEDNTYFYFFDSSSSALFKSKDFGAFLDNTNAFIQQNIGTKLTSEEIQIVFNSYNFMLGNKVIDRDFGKIVIGEDRNALEFLVYPFNNQTINFGDFIKTNQLNILSKFSIDKQKEQDKVIEDTYKSFKDWYSKLASLVSTKEGVNQTALLRNGDNYKTICNTIDTSVNNACIVLLNGMKESLNSSTNLTAFNEYQGIKNYVCTLSPDNVLLKDNTPSGSGSGAIQSGSGVVSGTGGIVTEENTFPLYKDWLIGTNSVIYGMYKECNK